MKPSTCKPENLQCFANKLIILPYKGEPNITYHLSVKPQLSLFKFKKCQLCQLLLNKQDLRCNALVSSIFLTLQSIKSFFLQFLLKKLVPIQTDK